MSVLWTVYCTVGHAVHIVQYITIQMDCSTVYPCHSCLPRIVNKWWFYQKITQFVYRRWAKKWTKDFLSRRPPSASARNAYMVLRFFTILAQENCFMLWRQIEKFVSYMSLVPTGCLLPNFKPAILGAHHTTFSPKESPIPQGGIYRYIPWSGKLLEKEKKMFSLCASNPFSADVKQLGNPKTCRKDWFLNLASQVNLGYGHNKSQHRVRIACFSSGVGQGRKGIFCLLLSPTSVQNLRNLRRKSSNVYNSFGKRYKQFMECVGVYLFKYTDFKFDYT